MSQSRLPQLWCVETKNLVKDKSPIVHDGSTHYYQDFACVAFSAEEACSRLGPILDELGLELDTVLKCCVYDALDSINYSRRRSNMMLSAQKGAAMALLSGHHECGIPELAWGATSKQYASSCRDKAENVWAISVKVTFPPSHPVNFDGSDYAHEKYLVPGDTLDDALKALQPCLDECKQVILEVLYAEIHTGYKCYPTYMDDFSSFESEYAKVLDLNLPVNCERVGSASIDADD